MRFFKTSKSSFQLFSFRLLIIWTISLGELATADQSSLRPGLLDRCGQLFRTLFKNLKLPFGPTMSERYLDATAAVLRSASLSEPEQTNAWKLLIKESLKQNRPFKFWLINPFTLRRIDVELKPSGLRYDKDKNLMSSLLSEKPFSIEVEGFNPEGSPIKFTQVHHFQLHDFNSTELTAEQQDRIICSYELSRHLKAFKEIFLPQRTTLRAPQAQMDRAVARKLLSSLENIVRPPEAGAPKRLDGNPVDIKRLTQILGLSEDWDRTVETLVSAARTHWENDNQLTTQTIRVLRQIESLDPRFSPEQVFPNQVFVDEIILSKQTENTITIGSFDSRAGFQHGALDDSVITDVSPPSSPEEAIKRLRAFLGSTPKGVRKRLVDMQELSEKLDLGALHYLYQKDRARYDEASNAIIERLNSHFNFHANLGSLRSLSIVDQMTLNINSLKLRIRRSGLSKLDTRWNIFL